MRPIDADELHDELKKQPKWVVKRDGFTNEGYSYDQVHFTIDKIPTAEPTEEQVKEYCRKRSLIIVTAELFNEMKARLNAPTQESVGKVLKALDVARERLNEYEDNSRK